MAACAKSVCGCPTRLLFNTVNSMRSYMHRINKNYIVSLSKACFMYVQSPGVTAGVRSHIVTSTCCKGRPLHAFGETTKAAFHFESARCSRLPLHSFFNKFPYKHKLWQSRTLFSCRNMNLHKTVNQSETSAVDKRNVNQFDNSSTKEGHISEKRNSTNEKSEKKENIKTIPNLLTTLRMASAPLLGYMVVSENFGLALGLFAFAGITDLLDGYIARNFPNQTSALGSALDPLADKLLVTILTLSLTSVGVIPLPLTGLIVFRDISLIAGGFYIRYRSLTPPITLSRYFDISHATVSLAPTFISKVNTGLQLSLVACSLAAPVFGFVDHIILQMLWWTTGTTTFLSGADYMCSWKKYVTLLEKDQKEL